MHPPRAGLSVRPPESDAGADAGRILIVDDSPEARLIRRRALQRTGFDVHEAGTATAGLAAIAERRPDVVILDVNLPDMHGFDVCRRIKADRPHDPIAVVQVSASSVGTAEQVSGLEGGADAYLTEPIDPSVLVATVKAVLRERRTSAELRRANDRLGFAQRAAGAGVWDLDPDGGAAWWSPELAVVQGLADDVPRTVAGWLSGIHPEDRAAVAGALEARAGDGAVLDIEARLATGTVRWVHLSGRRERVEGSGARLAGLTVDITRRRRTQEQLRTLQELTATLSAAARPEEVLRKAVEATWRALDSDSSSIGVLRGGTLDVQLGVPDATVEARYGTLVVDSDRDRGLPVVDTTVNGTVIRLNGTAEIAAAYPALVADPDFAGLRALLVVPLRSPDRVRGFLAAYSHREQRFDTADLDALTAIAQVSNQALERAEVYAAEARARADAEAAAHRTRLRAELIEQLERLRAPEERRRALLAFCAAHLADHADLLPPGTTRAGAAGPRHALLTLATRGHTLGHIRLVRDTRDFSDEDRLLIREIAAPSALLLDNARLDEEQREIARSLQFSLLEGSLTTLPPDVSAVLRYLPGEAGLHVGGDWHDVLERPDGRVLLMIGDVAGHGLEAAGAMGTIRGAGRALGRTLGDPAAILAGLDATAEDSGGMATAACVLLDPGTGELVYARAGHPPPLVLSPDGGTRFLEDGLSMPLAGFAPERRSAADRLAPGELVVLYTDGLIERRGTTLDAGLDRLRATAAANAAQPTLAGLADAFLEQMTGDGPVHDDIALIAARRAATPAEAVTWRAAGDRAHERLREALAVLAGAPGADAAGTGMAAPDTEAPDTEAPDTEAPDAGAATVARDAGRLIAGVVGGPAGSGAGEVDVELRRSGGGRGPLHLAVSTLVAPHDHPPAVREALGGPGGVVTRTPTGSRIDVTFTLG